MVEKLTSNNIIEYAAKHYYNPLLTHVDDFYDDYKRFKYIKRIINKYLTSGVMNERILLNHLVICGNCFTVQATLMILIVKMNDEHWSVLKPMLLFLNFTKPSDLQNVSNDEKITKLLRNI